MRSKGTYKGRRRVLKSQEIKEHHICITVKGKSKDDRNRIKENIRSAIRKFKRTSDKKVSFEISY